jgi:hypothetical protein
MLGSWPENSVDGFQLLILVNDGPKYRSDSVIPALHLTLARFAPAALISMVFASSLPIALRPNTCSFGRPTRTRYIHLFQGSPPPCQQRTQPQRPSHGHVFAFSKYNKNELLNAGVANDYRTKTKHLKEHHKLKPILTPEVETHSNFRLPYPCWYHWCRLRTRLSRSPHPNHPRTPLPLSLLSSSWASAAHHPWQRS